MFVLLSLLLAASPDAGVVPTPREMAQLYFIAGDLRRAVDFGRRCVQLDKKKCELFYRALVEYQALIPKNDRLSRAEARQYLEWDHLVSPERLGALSVDVNRKFITDPMDAANAALVAGDCARAEALAKTVLEVSPKHLEAQRLSKSCVKP
jgi:hypothetical protein